MNNNEIAEHFSLLARLMDLHGENSFKSKSYSIAAFTIEKLPKELDCMDDAELFSIKGIGDAIGKKIREVIATGKLPLLAKMIAQTPPGILEIMNIKGLGPKKTAIIWNELGIETIGELEYACNENRLVTLKGFGAKTQESVLKSIEFIRNSKGYYLWAEAYTFANSILEHFKAYNSNSLVSFTGALRRQCEVVTHIDFITDLEKAKLIDFFNTIEKVVVNEESDNILIISMPLQPIIRFYISDKAQYYINLFKTTGSEEFLDGFNNSFSLPELAENEESIFSHNKMQVIPAPQRESKEIIKIAQNNDLQQLIEHNDIKGIIHSHSKWSDGNFGIEEMAKAAKDKGFEYLVISDHSQSAFYANGLTQDRVAAQHCEIDNVNAKLAPFKIFKSIESDILNDGSLDYSTSVLNTFDLVIASVHSNLKMSQTKAMDRVLTAIKNPYTTILGHPTGRLLLSRPGYPLDFKTIIDECAAHKVVIEINAHPRRLDLDWQWIEYAMQCGVMLSINPDAHSITGFNDVFYGVMISQKGGLTAKQNLSSFSLAAFESFVEVSKLKRLV